MGKPLPSGNKMLNRALARSAAKKLAPAAQTEPAKPTLSEQEIQHYIDILLEASKSDPTSRLERLMNASGDLTHKMLVEKYKDHQAG